MKEQRYYFTHDADAKDDAKCMLLIDSLGLEGYGIFWVLVEVLRMSENYRCSLQLIPSLARKYNTTKEKMETVIKAYNLFVVEDGEFFSIRLKKNMDYFNAKKTSQSIGGKNSAKTRMLKSGVNTDNFEGTSKLLASNLKESANILRSNKIKIKEKENKNKIKDSISLTQKNENPKKNGTSEKKQFSDFVSLSEKEYQTLIEKNGKEITDKCIEKLNYYKMSSGKKYKSDYGAINHWVLDRVNEDLLKNTAVKGNYPAANNEYDFLKDVLNKPLQKPLIPDDDETMRMSIDEFYGV